MYGVVQEWQLTTKKYFRSECSGISSVMESLVMTLLQIYSLSSVTDGQFSSVTLYRSG